MFTNVHSDEGYARLVFGDVRQAFEQGGEARLRIGLRIGGGVLVAFPGESEALGVEAAEQPHQQPLARHALLADQLALMADLLDPAMDGAVEGERGQASDGKLLRGVPRGGEGGRADPERISGARRQASGPGRKMDRAGLRQSLDVPALPGGVPAADRLAARFGLEVNNAGRGRMRLRLRLLKIIQAARRGHL